MDIAHPCRQIVSILRLASLCGLCVCPAILHADWRKDLLKERGIALDEASLRKASLAEVIAGDDLLEAYTQLAAEEFEKREQAQKRLTEAGDAVLDFFDTQEPIKDPEIRVRVGEIRKAVTSGVKPRLGPIVRHAAKSLLDKPEDPTTGGLYYEGFDTEAKDCRKGYRELLHEGPATSQLHVAKGRLYIPGDLDGDNDQRLLLASKTWPAAKHLPERIEVSCLMGGEAQGSGTWHAGLCVGKLKVLFHPAYRGGGFRFEQVGTHENLSMNQNMGFTPLVNQLYRVELTLTRLPQDKVEARAVVLSPDGKRFESTVVVDSEKAGELNRISIERSGRQGGAAIFDDLQIKLEE